MNYANTLRTFAAALCLLAGIVATPVHAEKYVYYHLDALGSPVAVTDQQGTLLWREDYKPYGDRILNDPAAANNARWYTGHVQDPDTELVYAGARYYDPVIGRFMATDPVAFTEKNRHTFNRYAYANDNPYRYVDPDGEASLTIHGGVVASFGSTGSPIDVNFGKEVGFSVSLPSSTSEFDIGITITNSGGAEGSVPPGLTRAPTFRGRIGPTGGMTVAEGSVLDLEGSGTVAGGEFGAGPHWGYDQQGNVTSVGFHVTPGVGFSVTGEKTEVISVRRGMRRAGDYIGEQIRGAVEKAKDRLLQPRFVTN